MTNVSPEIKAEVSVVRNRRTDAMFVAAYIAVGALCYVVIYETKIGEFAQGIVTLVLGMFLNELKGMYSYEQGTTRASEQKGLSIARIAEATPAATAAAVAATVAATAAATPGAPAALVPVEVPPATPATPPQPGGTT